MALFNGYAGREGELTRIKFEGSVMTFDASDAARADTFLGSIALKADQISRRTESANSSADRKIASIQVTLQKYVND
ncbi:hypothetical protein [Brevibacterium aurantiacum]|uniref:Uncharacterized protein n=1 Tax=Brevibacterium aurantiacum TaxID=273384 RepID=A0A3T0DD45_BREAU|nr:hypothetical protein [Brevibacterium aurantiacum]AZT92926.1 hypothetical protein CXR23_07045 [Brevibacterium aurantiacum]